MRSAPIPRETLTPTATDTPTQTLTPTPSFTVVPTQTPTATTVPQNGHVVYVYDGDGNLVKSVIGDVVTYYPNGSYELKVSGSNEVITKYYSAGASRIAYRINGTITWLLNDHLGSTVGTVDEDGELIGTLKYTAYGELRTGSSSTDYRYTGQREESEIGLYYYVARMYDPAVGRFISADTIVPDPASSQGYDRYGYVNGNPINRNDPSGHMAVNDESPYDPAPLPITTPTPTPLLPMLENQSTPELPNTNEIPVTVPPPHPSTPYRPTDDIFDEFLETFSIGISIGDDVLNEYHIPGPLSFVFDGSLQLLRDRDTQLSIYEKSARAAIAGFEGGIIGGLSTGYALAAMAVTSETGAGPVFGIATYLASNVTTSRSFNTLNSTYVFPWVSEFLP